VQALQAKVAAMLLHPRRRAWKVLMQRAFQRYVPALGPAVFVSTYKAGRSSRHVEYWRAITRLKPHRLLEPERMSAHQHLQERLAGGNCRITRHGDSLVPSSAWLQELLPAVQDAGGLTVGGLRVALGSSDAAVLRAAERVRACIGQPEWIEAASTQALPPADWWQSPCGGSVYCQQAAPEGGKGFAVRVAAAQTVWPKPASNQRLAYLASTKAATKARAAAMHPPSQCELAAGGAHGRVGDAAWSEVGGMAVCSVFDWCW
jgi:hypothetical protein